MFAKSSSIKIQLKPKTAVSKQRPSYSPEVGFRGKSENSTVYPVRQKGLIAFEHQKLPAERDGNRVNKWKRGMGVCWGLSD